MASDEAADARRALRRQGEEVLDEVAADLIPLATTTRRRMFGGTAICARDKIVAFVSSTGELVVKVPAERAAELVDAGAATRMQMGRGVAKEWVGVPQPADPDDDAVLDLWRILVHESYGYVSAPTG